VPSITFSITFSITRSITAEPFSALTGR